MTPHVITPSHEITRHHKASHITHGMHACKGRNNKVTSHEIISIELSHINDKVDPHGKVPKRERHTLGALQAISTQSLEAPNKTTKLHHNGMWLRGDLNHLGAQTPRSNKILKGLVGASIFSWWKCRSRPSQPIPRKSTSLIG